MERKIHFRENRPIVWGIWGEAELILRIWGAKENTFRELRNFYHQCIIFRDQWSTTPPLGGGGGGSKMRTFSITSHYFA